VLYKNIEQRKFSNDLFKKKKQSWQEMNLNSKKKHEISQRNELLNELALMTVHMFHKRLFQN